ncbi:MAG: recombinase family protein [Anaerolineae bacterium]|nr:recombinase family protein [Anaerolineae bacterium]
MIANLAKHKIRPEHLALLALIYIRQSSLAQVRRHTASTARQYDLRQRALDLGWPETHIIVIDEDQGQSGASATDRDGFQRLVAEVGLGHVGAVFSLEASRLARSCSDWYRMIEICGLAHTLVIDEEGIYDPNQYNDRLLLGFKGTMSEAELHWLKARLDGGKLERAQEGRLRFCLPTGLVHDSKGNIALDPDEQVQQAIHMVFELFDGASSARAVVKRFAAHKLLIPTRRYGGERHGELTWRPLGYGRVLGILRNPLYAGAYVYGRTEVRNPPLRTRSRPSQIRRDDWLVVIQDAHPGYITWEQFQRNQKRLDDNRTYRHEEHRGAVREGAALLQGIALCGHCGRHMLVSYPKKSTVPTYLCLGHKELASQTCQSIRGDGIDATVTQALLEAMQPAQLEISLASLEQIEERARQIDRQWQLRIERAQYEADLARRRFYNVEPENRLVARSLEREWNEKLEAVQCLEREYANLPSLTARLSSPEERQRILSLAQDFPAVWHAPTTTNVERKQLLRLLIKDVTLTRQEKSIHIVIRWQTDAVTGLAVGHPKKVHEMQITSPAVVARVRELAPTHTDRQIAAILNAEGLATGANKPFTRVRVEWVRYANKIKSGCPVMSMACPDGRRGDGRYSALAAAKLLNVDRSTIALWCRSGKLDAVQEAPLSPYWIRLTPEIIERLRKPTQ